MRTRSLVWCLLIFIIATSTPFRDGTKYRLKLNLNDERPRICHIRKRWNSWRAGHKDVESEEYNVNLEQRAASNVSTVLLPN
jgi:hypothetical protein